MMASADKFELTLKGRSAHAARPNDGLDTIALSAHVIQAIHQIVSRRTDPIDEGVITIGTIQGGTKDNIIADTVEMTGTIRSFSQKNRELLHQELERACGVAEALGGQFTLNIIKGYPPTINDDLACDRMMSATRSLLGEDKVFEANQVMAAEDFSFMAQAAPGCFLRLGTHNPDWVQRYPVHTPTFRLDEEALPVGAASLVATVLTWLKQN